ncbi:MAG: ATP-binding protein [Clostridia bacterium]|nr:ATP-binding protein [Clostridia bacterium]
MPYDRETFRRVMSTYSEKAQKAFNDAELKKAELHNKFPLLKKMDDEISRLPLNILRESGLGSDGLQERLAKLKKEYDDLLSARAELLRTGGYPEDYTDIVYECKKCRDTGYDGINLCSCAKKLLTLESYKSSGMYRLITTQSFDNFSLDVYKSAEHKKHMSTIFNNAKKYAREFNPDSSPSLFFAGDTGLGKTHISSAIAKEVIDKGYSVVYESAPGMMIQLEREHFGRGASDNDITDRYLTCDLLIIDDLGAEYITKINIGFLYNIVNTRILNGLPMIVSTNLDYTELEKRYERRMSSRFMGEFLVYPFRGEDMRYSGLLKK